MKKCFIIFALLLYASSAIGWMGGMMGGGVESAPAGCSGNFGSEGTDATTYGTETTIYITRFSLGCSGSNPASYAYFQYANTDVRRLIVVAYEDVPGATPEPGGIIGATDPFYDAGNSSAQTLSVGTITGSFSGDYVWIGIQYEYSGSKPSWAASGGDTREYATTFGSPPATWPTADDTATAKVVNAYISF